MNRPHYSNNYDRRGGFNRFNEPAMENDWGPSSGGSSYFNLESAQGWDGGPETCPEAMYSGRRQLQSHAKVRRRRSNARNAPPSGVRGFVRELLRKNPILMMSFTYCPACKKLAAKLDEQHITYRKYEVDRVPNNTQIMDEFERLSGIRTAPQMFVNGRFIGDGSTTRRLIASGKFHALIGRKNDTNIFNAPDLVDNSLQWHPVLMMSFTYCPCCINLAKKLDAAGIYYYKLEVDTLPNRNEVIREFEKRSGIKTAPQMFVAGEFVGDGSTTGNLIATGRLQHLIRSSVGR